MGSPVCVVLAELAMQKLEKTMFEEAPYQPILWKRYLDDIFAILPTNQVDAHLSYLNSLNSYINFTIEKEADSKLPFLDLLIHRNSSSRFSFSIYRKDTHTENYLNFNSNNPVCHNGLLPNHYWIELTDFAVRTNFLMNFSTLKIP